MRQKTEDLGAISGSREPDPQAVPALSGFDPGRFEWRTQTAQYSHGKDLLVAGMRVGSAFYDGVSSRTVSHRYKIETRLPGVRPTLDRFATEEEARAALERFTVAWLERVFAAAKGTDHAH